MKVKLPKEVAEAIEFLRDRQQSDSDILTGTFGSANTTAHLTIKTYAEYNIAGICSAILNGYEVEETPEDKVRAIWKNADYKYMSFKGTGEDARQYWNGYIGGIEGTLEALGIKIEGVNV